MKGLNLKQKIVLAVVVTSVAIVSRFGVTNCCMAIRMAMEFL